MFCKNCGQELNGNAKFCKGCGAHIEKSKAPDFPIEVKELEYDDEIYEERELVDRERDYYPSRRKKKKNLAAITLTICILIVMVLIGCVLYALFASNGEFSLTVDDYPSKVHGASYTLEGTAISEDSDAVILIDNKVIADIYAGDEECEWSYEVFLDEGKNTIAITLSDEEGRREVTKKVEITLERGPSLMEEEEEEPDTDYEEKPYSEEEKSPVIEKEEEKPTIIEKEEEKPNPQVFYRVQSASFGNRGNAQILCDRIKGAGFEAIVVQVGYEYKVQCGAFSSYENASAQVRALANSGFAMYITAG